MLDMSSAERVDWQALTCTSLARIAEQATKIEHDWPTYAIAHRLLNDDSPYRESRVDPNTKVKRKQRLNMEREEPYRKQAVGARIQPSRSSAAPEFGQT